jgi:hypothetical protein
MILYRHTTSCTKEKRERERKRAGEGEIAGEWENEREKKRVREGSVQWTAFPLSAIENLALGGKQTFASPPQTSETVSSKAVDANIQVFEDTMCYRSQEGRTPYWVLDFGTPTTFTHIQIWNFIDGKFLVQRCRPISEWLLHWTSGNSVSRSSWPSGKGVGPESERGEVKVRWLAPRLYVWL